jgi:nicotinamide-nucleotide amidase
VISENGLSEGYPRATAVSLIAFFAARGLKIATAESCTGGLVSALLTDVSGSSAVLWGGVVAYSNDCKMELLGVKRETIENHGAVSAETARAMSTGMLKKSGADWAIAITGIAGPTGGSVEKPVGLVWFSWAKKDDASREESKIFAGDRRAVRAAAAEHALHRALEYANLFPGVAGNRTVDIDKPLGGGL